MNTKYKLKINIFFITSGHDYCQKKKYIYIVSGYELFIVQI